MDEQKGITARTMECQTCGKRWSGTFPDCYILAFRHAKRTGHYVYGETISYTEWNRDASEFPLDRPVKGWNRPAG